MQRFHDPGGVEFLKVAEENVGMKVPVIFVTGQVGIVQGAMLDYLIAEKEIAAFRRSDGWVQVGLDPIRLAQHPRPGSGARDGFSSGRTGP